MSSYQANKSTSNKYHLQDDRPPQLNAESISSRRSTVVLATAAIAAMLGNPRPSLASYALYQADRAEWDRRTDNGAKKLSSDMELV